MATLTKITPCLWFDTQGEDAATFYTSVFPNSRVIHVAHYGSAGPREAGMVMTVVFELAGQEFVALNGEPDFTFGEAISFQVNCESQAEVDRYWQALSDAARKGRAAGSRTAFGVSWQIVPVMMDELNPRPRHREGAAGHEGHARHEEARRRRPGAGCGR